MGKKISDILKNKDVGAIGIGAMIVFIAMVLVAGIAASVLVQTANKLEIQAMQTGDQTTAEVASGISVADISGDLNGGDDIQYMLITVQPRAGSDDIDLSQTFIEISDSTMKNVLTYESADFYNKSEINGDLFGSFFDNIGAQSFGVIVLEDADSTCTWDSPVLNRGDKVALSIHCASGKVFNGKLGERTDVWGMIQPEDGAAGVFGFRSPASYAGDSVFDLY